MDLHLLDMNRNLLDACIEGNIHIVKYIIEVSGKEYYSNDPKCADYVVYKACSNGHLHVVKYLLDNGADIDRWGGFSSAHQRKYFHINEYLIRTYEHDMSNEVFDNICWMYFEEPPVISGGRGEFDAYMIKKRYVLKLLNLCVNDFYNLF